MHRPDWLTNQMKSPRAAQYIKLATRFLRSHFASHYLAGMQSAVYSNFFLVFCLGASGHLSHCVNGPLATRPEEVAETEVCQITLDGNFPLTNL